MNSREALALMVKMWLPLVAVLMRLVAKPKRLVTIRMPKVARLKLDMPRTQKVKVLKQPDNVLMLKAQIQEPLDLMLTQKAKAER